MSDNKEVDIESNSLSASNGDHSNPQLGANEIFIDPVVLKRITSKFDKFMMPQMAVLMIIAYLDRSNIGLFQLPSWVSAFKSQTNLLKAMQKPSDLRKVWDLPATNSATFLLYSTQPTSYSRFRGSWP
jgi:hypothetical protein